MKRKADQKENSSNKRVHKLKVPSQLLLHQASIGDVPSGVADSVSQILIVILPKDLIREIVTYFWIKPCEVDVEEDHQLVAKFNKEEPLRYNLFDSDCPFHAFFTLGETETGVHCLVGDSSHWYYFHLDLPNGRTQNLIKVKECREEPLWSLDKLSRSSRLMISTKITLKELNFFVVIRFGEEFEDFGYSLAVNLDNRSAALRWLGYGFLDGDNWIVNECGSGLSDESDG